MVNTQKILIEKKSRKKRINEKNTNNEYRITEKVLKTVGGDTSAGQHNKLGGMQIGPK